MAKLELIPALVNSATLPVVAFANTTYPVPVPGAVTLMLSATLARDTYKLGTNVFDVTVNGAVPTATLETSVEAVTAPETPKLVNVPVLVMLGCAAVVTVPAVVALVAAPLNAPTNVVAVIELADRLAVIPVLVTSDTLPVAAFANTRKLFPVPAATVIKSLTLA